MKSIDRAVLVPQDPDHRWEWIKFQLRVKGTSLAKIARALGVSGPAVRNAKHLPYPRMERAIALALGFKPIEIWPERWGANGKPSRRRPNASEKREELALKNNAAYDVGHSKNGAEA